ncbi:MAG: hypothetical protein E7773_04125 [Sphingomonas sp.]|uniref:hypothetical protein n=1 Tax=Sphingomonas sp. TaxID=28214 RepID=UPI0012184CC1|nr:hypothetical protein [Sphingomonas sp.]THD37230.1 MAG: hypothetical protein E7773_04125 [Sphingomonas sp.]
MRIPLALVAVALLAGCHSRTDDPGAVSPEEDRMLNEAAASQDVNATAAPTDNAQAVDQGNTQ